MVRRAIQRPNLDARSLSPLEISGLQRAIGNRAVAQLIFGGRRSGQQGDGPSQVEGAVSRSNRSLQTKLTIGAPDDPHEREADAVADQVMASLATLRRKDAVNTESHFEEASPDGFLPKPIQLQQASPGIDTGQEAPGIVEDVLATSGTPLAESARRSMQTSFGRDFSQVQVHDGAAAAESAAAVDALAYTVGNHIVFGQGQYAPGTNQGDRLLAHELTHVVQQSGTRDCVASLNTEIRREGSDAGGGAGAPAAPAERLGGSLWALDPSGKALPPSLDDISQGSVNDCFLFAAISAIVNANPQQIVDMIQDNGDGTYTVTFRGIGFFSSAKQTVSADFTVGKHGYLTGRKALWPLIIEKAYGQQKGGLSAIDKGGNAGSAIDDMLNDGPSRFDPRDKTPDYIMGKVAKAKDKKWPMTILSPKEDDSSTEKKSMAEGIPGLHFWHTYAIVDVDPTNNRLKLFNPWGRDHPNGDGWLGVDQIKKFFTEIDIND